MMDIQPENKYKQSKFETLLVHGRVSEFMTIPPITLTKNKSMLDAKVLMRDNRISGIPIVNGEGQLEGIVTIENIIIAIENDYIDDLIDNHMIKDVMFIYDDMDVSIVMEFLRTYSYGRYPVLDRDNRVVGVVTKGDLMVYLYTRLGSIYTHNKRRDEILKPRSFPEMMAPSTDEHAFSYNIATEDLDTAGIGSTLFKKFIEERGFPSEAIRRASISLYEAEVNVVIHGGGKGYIRAYLEENQLSVVVNDYGPGIDDIEQALEPGYTTATDKIRERGFGAGMGLANIKKYTNKLVIVSSGNGLKIEFVIFATPKNAVVDTENGE